MWKIGNRFDHKIFIVDSLYYYVLTIIFVALESVEKYDSYVLLVVVYRKSLIRLRIYFSC